MSNRPYRALIAGLAALPPVSIAGQEYTGAELAVLLAVNPEQPVAEAAVTPQIVCELGRLTANAYRNKELAEVRYRVWRDSTVHLLTNNLQEATTAGFACAADPGLDAKGKQKPSKLPSTSAVEVYLRTLPDYRDHYEAKIATEEAWQVVHAAYEAAKSRTWAIRSFDANGGAAAAISEPPRVNHSVAPPPPPPRRS